MVASSGGKIDSATTQKFKGLIYQTTQFFHELSFSTLKLEQSITVSIFTIRRANLLSESETHGVMRILLTPA